MISLRLAPARSRLRPLNLIIPWDMTAFISIFNLTQYQHRLSFATPTASLLFYNKYLSSGGSLVAVKPPIFLDSVPAPKPHSYYVEASTQQPSP